jgi:hypothetical protein
MWSLGGWWPAWAPTCLTWLLSFPWRYGGAILPPAPAYEWWLTSKGVEPPDRYRPIMLPRIGRCRLLTTLQGVQSHQDCNLFRCWWSRSLMYQTFYGEHIWCQGDHDDYVCSCGRVHMSGGYGIDSSTRVHVCQERVGVCGYVLLCQALNATASRGLGFSGFARYWKALKHGCQGPGYVPSRVVRRRYSGRIGDEILPIRGHWDGREVQ